MVVKQISDINYCIQHAHHPRKRMVVHFDRLKPFNGDVQESSSKGNGPPVQSSETPSTSSPTSHTMMMMIIRKWPMQNHLLIQLLSGTPVALTISPQDLVTTFLTELGTSSSEKGE